MHASRATNRWDLADAFVAREGEHPGNDPVHHRGLGGEVVLIVDVGAECHTGFGDSHCGGRRGGPALRCGWRSVRNNMKMDTAHGYSMCVFVDLEPTGIAFSFDAADSW